MANKKVKAKGKVTSKKKASARKDVEEIVKKGTLTVKFKPLTLSHTFTHDRTVPLPHTGPYCTRRIRVKDGWIRFDNEQYSGALELVPPSRQPKKAKKTP